MKWPPSWLSILWWVVQLLGPVIAQFLGAQLAAFTDKNPAWKDVPAKGLGLLKELGLATVQHVEDYSFPENVTKEQRQETLFQEALRLLAELAQEEMLYVTTNDLRRTVEDAVTAYKQGMRTTNKQVKVSLAKVIRKEEVEYA